MANKMLRLLKIKKGKVEMWKSWCYEYSHTYRKEAEQLMADTGVTKETMFLFKDLDENYYVLSDTVFVDETYKQTDQSLSMNEKYREKVSECLEMIDNQPEVLYSIPE